MAKFFAPKGGQVIGGMSQDPYTMIANLRKEFSYMRVNLDTYQSAAAQAEDAKMNLAFELKVFGNKRRLSHPPPHFMFGSLYYALVPYPPPSLLFFFPAFFCPVSGRTGENRSPITRFTGLSQVDCTAKISNHFAGTPSAEGDFGYKEPPEGTWSAGKEDEEVGSRARRSRGTGAAGTGAGGGGRRAQSAG